MKIVPGVSTTKGSSVKLWKKAAKFHEDTKLRGTYPLSESRGGLLLLLDLLGPSPLRSRPGDRPLPAPQFWSSVTMAVPLVRLSVGMLIPEGAMS